MSEHHRARERRDGASRPVGAAVRRRLDRMFECSAGAAINLCRGCCSVGERVGSVSGRTGKISSRLEGAAFRANLKRRTSSYGGDNCLTRTALLARRGPRGAEPSPSSGCAKICRSVCVPRPGRSTSSQVENDGASFKDRSISAVLNSVSQRGGSSASSPSSGCSFVLRRLHLEPVASRRASTAGKAAVLRQRDDPVANLRWRMCHASIGKCSTVAQLGA